MQRVLSDREVVKVESFAWGDELSNPKLRQLNRNELPSKHRQSSAPRTRSRSSEQ